MGQTRSTGGMLRSGLRSDPTPYLMQSGYEPVVYFTRRDLLELPVPAIAVLWSSREPSAILKLQQRDGRWRYPAGGDARIRSRKGYDQLETYRRLGQLVEKFGFNRSHPAISKAASFLFGQQTDEGDFRGIYGRQYSPNYTAGIMELLIKAGYSEDSRIAAGFEWLFSIRQRDGGWAIPFRTVSGRASWATIVSAMRAPTMKPDLAKPSSHLVTGVVLRAFAAHARLRRSEEARVGGELLASRIFKEDTYVDRKATSFWKSVSFPFWFTDVVSALDSLSWLGMTRRDRRIARALEWLKSRQSTNGRFRVKLLRTGDSRLDYWVCLATSRVFKRFFSRS